VSHCKRELESPVPLFHSEVFRAQTPPPLFTPRPTGNKQSFLFDIGSGGDGGGGGGGLTAPQHTKLKNCASKRASHAAAFHFIGSNESDPNHDEQPQTKSTQIYYICSTCRCPHTIGHLVWKQVAKLLFLFLKTFIFQDLRQHRDI